MKYSIWGYNKFKEPKCYALYVDSRDIDEYMARAEKDGWTGLVVDKKPQPQLFEDSETPASASSARSTSRRKKRASSTTSENA